MVRQVEKEEGEEGNDIARATEENVQIVYRLPRGHTHAEIDSMFPAHRQRHVRLGSIEPDIPVPPQKLGHINKEVDEFFTLLHKNEKR